MKTNYSSVFYKIGDYSAERLKELYNMLPQSRKDRIAKIDNEIYKEFLIVEFFIVINKLQKPASQDFLYNFLGKPYFNDCKLNFSISHSQNLLVVVFSQNPIGVDLQHFLPFDLETAKDVCNEKELQSILSSANKDREFTKIWTLKESLVKLHGTTMYLNMKDILNDANAYKFITHLESDYALSICIKNKD